MADTVVATLHDRGVPVFRTDLRDFPSTLRLRAELGGGRWSGTPSTEHRDVQLGDIRSIWHRHRCTYVFPASMTAEEQDFAHREARPGVLYLVARDGAWCEVSAGRPGRERSWRAGRVGCGR